MQYFLEQKQLGGVFLNDLLSCCLSPLVSQLMECSLVCTHHLHSPYPHPIPTDVCQVDQCPCGRYAEMECSLCGRRGYCGMQCQKEDWTNHIPECTGMSKKKKKKAGGGREYTPNVNTCICGKEADFECSVCGRQGYCSEVCQQKDWKLHVHYCKKEEPLAQ